jgi:hypothetical protein
MALTLIMLIIGLMSVLMIVRALDNSRAISYRSVQLESRRQVLQSTKSLLANEVVLNYSLNIYNKPSVNTQLRDCIMTGIPSVGGYCDGIDLSFYSQATATAGDRFLGSATNPAYVNQFGEACDPSVNTCLFKSIAHCDFSCPPGQSACATVKIMRCDLEISPVNGTIFKQYFLSKDKNEFVSELSIQIDPAQMTYSIFKL